MKLFGLALVSLTCLFEASAAPASSEASMDLRNLPIQRNGTQLELNGEHWTCSGANVYWLGLDENVIPPAGKPFYAPYNASYPTKGRITEIMNTVRTMGGRIIRSQTLGVSVGNPLSLWPTLKTRNTQAFDTIDWAVWQARRHGLRLQVPLIDNYNYYHGGKYVFLKWRGIDIDLSAGYGSVDPRVLEFYTNQTILDDFKDYVTYLLTHKNQYSGLTYAEDPTIALIETGNELGGPIFGDEYVPNSWTREIATLVKSLGKDKLVMDGTYGINSTHFALSDIDAFSDHFYPLNNSKLMNDIALVKGADRVYVAGEYDWTGLNGGDSLSSFYEIIEGEQSKEKPVIAGDLFWSLFMHNVPDCQQYVNHTDGFTLHYGDSNNTALADSHIKLIRQHFFAMQGQHVGLAMPSVACPGPTFESGGT